MSREASMVRYYADRAKEYERVYLKPERQEDLRWLHDFVKASSTPISRTDEEGNTYQNRRLENGTVHRIVRTTWCLGPARASQRR